jgi:hypothetical protein
MVQKGNEKNVMAHITLNGEDMYLNLNKPYILSNINLRPEDELIVHYPSKILIDYVFERYGEDDKTLIPKSIVEGEMWGQFFGIFTNDDLVFAKHNQNVHHSLNIYELIASEMQNLIESELKVSFNRVGQTWRSVDGTYQFELTDFTKIKIEADKGTEFKINNKSHWINETSYYSDFDNENYDLTI